RSPGVDLARRTGRLPLPLPDNRLRDNPLGQLFVAIVQAGDGEADVRTLPRQGLRGPDHVGQVAQQLLSARAGKDRHYRAGPSPMLGQETGVQSPSGQLVEIGMTDVDGLGDAASAIPGRLEREAAQNLIDEPANLPDP